MAAINFMIGTCAIPLKSILALIRAKYWLIELLAGLLVPVTMFPGIAKNAMWLPFEHIAFTPLQIYLGKISGIAATRALAVQWLWIAGLLWLGMRGGVAHPRKSRFMAAKDEANARRTPAARDCCGNISSNI